MTNDKGGFGQVCFLGKRNYRLPAIVKRDDAVSISVSTVLDTGAEQNLIHKRGIDPVWRSHVCLVQSPRLLDASERVMESCGLIVPTFRTGELPAIVPFLVVKNSAVHSLLGTAFIDN